MEHYLACSFSKYLCKRRLINQDYYDIYVYGTELTLSFLITVTIIIAAGLIAGDVLSSLIFLSVSILLRRFTGGYHANTYIKCKIITVGSYLMSFFASRYLSIAWWMYILIFIFGNTIIHFLAPIENPNKPLNCDEKKKNRALSHVVFSILSTAGLTASILLANDISILWFSMSAVLILMIISTIMKGGRKHEDEYCQKNS